MADSIAQSSWVWLQDNLLWACLAGASMVAKELNMAEEAYAALDEVIILLS